MRSIYIISLALFLTSPATALASDFFPNQPGRALFVNFINPTLSTSANPSVSEPPEDCRARIKGILCLVNPIQHADEVRTCLPGSDQFNKSLEAVHDLLPPQLQKVFCSIEVILVENELASLAYAGTMGPEPGGAAFMGIRRSLLEKSEKASAVFGWKEQKAFGIKSEPFKVVPEGPQVRLSTQTYHSTLLYIVAHEFGHILDFANSANDFACEDSAACSGKMNQEMAQYLVPAPGSWGELSWQNAITPKNLNSFPLWKNLCFYGCEKTLQLTDMVPFYEQLQRSSFHTTYAAVSPWEDFAEHMAFHVMAQDPFFQYRVDADNFQYLWEVTWTGQTEKRKWMDQFLSRDLIYPKVSQ